ncbi:MAG: hypothetical protein C5B56_02380 [Proteobacteria bacterium]|nr:MAG: hypothetical protein C5B56_02380 [Pseudomonadota bacterium]
MRDAQRARSRELPARARLFPWVYVLSAAAVLIHFAFNGRYGYFRDELYYAACGRHPAWGYVDHAPLAPWLAQLTRLMLGDSLRALRFLPALSAGLKVYLAGWMARELGGRSFAQALAALVVLLAPIYLTFDNFFSMNAFEPVFWMLCAAIVLRIAHGADARLWLLFGLVAGGGLLNKHSMLFFGSGLAVGLLLSPMRRQFARPWIWLGALVALLMFLPNLLWEIENGWPTLALYHAVAGTKYTVISPWAYLVQQTLLTNPLAVPIWLAGLWFLLGDPAGKKYSFLGWAYLVMLIEMLLVHGKIYYLAPAYIMLLAAGAVWIELRAVPRTGAWLRPAMVAPLLVAGVVAAPLAMPILSVKDTIDYCRFWDVAAVRVENVPLGSLPQIFADMFGWPEQVAAVARAYYALPAGERAQATILAYDYGEAGAIDYFGDRYLLPQAISGHNQYGLWGPRGRSANVVVAIGFTQAQLRLFFDDIRPAALTESAYAVPEESSLTVYVCRRPKASFEASWREWRYMS